MDVKSFDVPDTFKADLEKAVALLKQRGCREVYLFGSLALSHSHETSDIDIGVRGCPPERFFRIYSELEDELAHKVDFIDFDLEPDFFAMLTSIDEVRRIG